MTGATRATVKIINILIIVSVVFVFAFCKKNKTILIDVGLVENPGEKQPKYIPNGLVKRGEFVNVLEEKEVNGKKYYLVQILDVDTKGWVEEKWVHDGKLQTVTVIQDSDLYTRPNEKSPKFNFQVKSGLEVFQLSVKDEFTEIQYPGVQGFIKTVNLGQKSEIKRTIFVPGLGKAVVSASSQYKATEGTENQFDPRNLFDGSLQTAWCEGVSDAGVGESVSITFENAVMLNKIEVVNGWTASEQYYNINSRVASLKVASSDGGSASLTLQDSNFDYQPNDVSLSGSSFKFSIDDIFKGRDADTCISEIRLSGNAAR